MPSVLSRPHLAVAALVGLGTLWIATPRLRAEAAVPFHLRLVKSEPARGDSVASPKLLRLWFSEPATLAVTSIRLKSADGREMPLGKPMFSGDERHPVEATVGVTLAAGTYTVSYKTASRDMHPITGTYAFVVR